MSHTVLSTTPHSVPIEHYGGDTLTITITAPEELVGSVDAWMAQIRTNRTDGSVAATFSVVTPAYPNGPAYLVLSSEDSARLVQDISPVKMRAADGTICTTATYLGYWDCQVVTANPTGPDTVTTLAQGPITISKDVTR